MEVINTELLRTMALPELDEQGRLKQAGTALVLVGSAQQPGPAVLAARAVLRAGCAALVTAPDALALHLGLAIPEATLSLVGDGVGGSVEDVLKTLRKQQPGWSAALVLARTNVRPALLAITKQQVEVRPLDETRPANDDAWMKLAEAQDTVLVALDNGSGLSGAYNATHSYQVDEGPTGAFISGSIEVLSGVVAALLARGLEPLQAAVWGLHLFTLALEAATKDFGDEGVLASDIIRYIPGSLRYARRTTGAKKETSTAGFRRTS